MNERPTLEIIAPTVDEAVAQGLAELGLPREAVDVEVLDSGSKGLFGLGGRQVRIRLTLTGGDEPARPAAGPADPSPTPAAAAPVEAASPPQDEDEILRLARETVSGLLEIMKIKARIEASYGEEDEEGNRAITVDIHGNDLGILIGRRAEILNSLQYLVNLIVSKQVEHWVQIVVDVEGYRARRIRQLRQIARRMADQAMRTGRRQVLEPMAANERRIIHLELRDHPQVLTQSIGDEPARKVTIVPK
ncbi:MAG: Jag N-terminal domain-containing protein [Anaerolineales bacterium]|nr:Jag N-terminal domain-containing protein [Anaerolineales bacterium]